MNKAILLALFVAAVTVCDAKVVIPLPRDDASDAYIDQVLEKARQMIQEQGMDPADLPDGIAEFSETILGITFHGSAKATNGYFNGWSGIRRTGSTSLELNQATGQLKLTANIGLDSGTAGYDLYAEFMDIGLGASASANLQGLSLYLEGEMCLTAGCSVQLTVFEISQIGEVHVNVDGLGPLDWILETVVDLIADLIKDWVADMVEGPLKEVLQDVLNSLIPPIPAFKAQLKI